MTDHSEPGATHEDPPVLAEEDTGSATPTRRLRRARVTEPTQQELDALPADKRLELINQQRHSRHLALNSVGILFGVLFTAASLIATALTVRNTQDELRSTKEGQITDRYTKAVEQLGSTKRDVRLGAIYALERIAADSARDRPTIIAVLAAFTREHDPAPQADPPGEPDTDVHAALTALGRQHRGASGEPPLDLHGIRTPHIQLQTANLTRANLRGADLTSANLTRANLRDAGLDGADLTRANLNDANLHDATLSCTVSNVSVLDCTNLREANLLRADLTGANLSNANLFRAILDYAHLSGANLLHADLPGANLSGADLTSANLSNADLSAAEMDGANLDGADLRGANLGCTNLRLGITTLRGCADLRSAYLRGTDLRSADLRGADLRGVRGMSAEEIRKQARTDATTRF